MTNLTTTFLEGYNMFQLRPCMKGRKVKKGNVG